METRGKRRREGEEVVKEEEGNMMKNGVVCFCDFFERSAVEITMPLVTV